MTAEIYSLGAFQLLVNAEPVTAWRAGRSRSLFQYLLLHRGDAVSHGTLQEAMWPARPRACAANSLKVAVHALRRILAAGAALAVDSTPDGYLLRTVGGACPWVDYEELERLGRTARDAAARGETAAEIAAATAASEVYQGDYLPSENAEWALAHRAWARVLILRILHGGRVSAMRAHDCWAAMALCRRTLEIEPYDEHSFQTMMWLHASHGDRTELVSWYNRCCDRLRLDLDLAPAPVTRRLYDVGMRRVLPEPPGDLLLSS